MAVGCRGYDSLAIQDQLTVDVGTVLELPVRERRTVQFVVDGGETQRHAVKGAGI